LLWLRVIPTFARYFLPRIHPRLRRERPALRLFLREETSGDAVESLHHGRADCVLLALPYPSGEVEHEHIADDRLFVAFPKGDPRNPPAEIPASMIDPDRLLLLEDGHCLKEHALAACNRPELRASATMIGTSLHTLVQMVDNGLGMTMLPEMAIDAGILRDTDVVARPLKARHNTREIALIWRKNSPRAEEFKLLAKELRAG
jgi:LysR family hydrogen peroxide-inducible transcriptional activator